MLIPFLLSLSSLPLSILSICIVYYSYPISRDIADDFLTQTWFIVLLGSIIAIIVFLLGALVLFKRYQFIKQTSLGSLHGEFITSNIPYSLYRQCRQFKYTFFCCCYRSLTFGGSGLV